MRICHTFPTTSEYCCEDIKLIEGYDRVVEGWPKRVYFEIHHRFETRDAEGKPLDVLVSSKLLKQKGLYFQRPASELIFLTEKEHYDEHWNKNNLGKYIMYPDGCKILASKVYEDLGLRFKDPGLPLTAENLNAMYKFRGSVTKKDLSCIIKIPLAKCKKKRALNGPQRRCVLHVHYN